MSNNKQQTAVEWLAKKIDYLIPFVSDEHAKYLNSLKEQAKEIQKDQHIKTWEAGLMKVDFNEYYEQTYGGNK